MRSMTKLHLVVTGLWRKGENNEEISIYVDRDELHFYVLSASRLSTD